MFKRRHSDGGEATLVRGCRRCPKPGVTTAYPDEPTQASTARQVALHSVVTSKMIHKCGAHCQGPTGGCKNYFDRNKVLPRTRVNARGYPEYKRRAKDLFVVSYTPEILLDWGGHANVTYASSVHCIFYLFNYLYKGHKKTMQKLEAVGKNEKEDPFDDYIAARRTSSMTAAWLACGYQTYPSPSPGVYCIKIVNPLLMQTMAAEGKATDIGVYFERPQPLSHLTLSEFFYRFRRDSKRPRGNNREYYEIEMFASSLKVFIVERSRIGATIIRLNKTSHGVGEQFYIRLLLKFVPANSFESLRRFNGITYETFQAAAVARGLVDDFVILRNIFDEMVLESYPYSLRVQFALLTLQGYPTLQLLDILENKEHLVRDHLDNGIPFPIAFNMFLEDLRGRLADDLKTLDDFGFPHPEQMTTLLERERLRYASDACLADYRAMSEQYPATDEQSQFESDIFLKLMSMTSASPAHIVALQGSGGVGKTVSLRKLIARIRSVGKIVLGCAATAIAASQIEDFHTAHSLFDLPVIDKAQRELDSEFEYKSKLTSHPEKLELLQECHVIVWDEVHSNAAEALDAASAALNGFTGKIVILAGDIKQILGIPTDNSHETLLQTIAVNSRLWRRKSRQYEFTKNMRMLQGGAFTEDERELFSAYLKTAECIGLGRPDGINVINLGEPTFKRDNNALLVKNVPALTTVPTVLQFLYPDGFDSTVAQSATILSTTNVKVNEWNKRVQDLNPNPAHVFKSKDVFADVDDDDGRLQTMLTESNMKKADRPDAPPHELILKIGDIVLITHSIARREKLVNNCRAQILGFFNNFIRVQTLGNNPIVHLIPRIRTRIKIHDGLDMALTRTQFPLRLAYSCTHNKSQSQSLDKVVIDITHELFAHGHVSHFSVLSAFCFRISFLELTHPPPSQLYVAMTRARHPNNVRFFTTPEQLADFPGYDIDGAVIVNNIVHKHIIAKVCPLAYSNFFCISN